MQPHGFENLGAKDKPQDERDIKLGAAAPAQYTFPKTLTNEKAWALPVEYQGQQPACGAHAGSEIKSVAAGRRMSPRFTWADIKTFDGNAIEVGTDLRSIFKSITKTGALPFEQLGNDVALPLEQYAKLANMPALKQSAAPFAGMGYGFIQDRTFDGLKQFIADHYPLPVIILVRLGKEWWTSPDGTSSWADKDIIPVRPPQQVVSGHFVVAHSYDEDEIFFLNHWSDAWGRKGHGSLKADYMPFFNDAGALFPLRFEKNLSKGMTDPDVLALQKILNKNPKTQVAATGAGSPGKETTYFGNLTFDAVVRFQALYSIKPTSGFVGPLTRAVLNGFV